MIELINWKYKIIDADQHVVHEDSYTDENGFTHKSVLIAIDTILFDNLGHKLTCSAITNEMAQSLGNLPIIYDLNLHNFQQYSINSLAKSGEFLLYDEEFDQYGWGYTLAKAEPGMDIDQFFRCCATIEPMVVTDDTTDIDTYYWF